MYDTKAKRVLRERILAGVRVGTQEELMRRSGCGMTQTNLNAAAKYSPAGNSGLVYMVVTPTRIAFFNVKKGFLCTRLGALLAAFPRSALKSMEVLTFLTGSGVTGGEELRFGIESQKGRYAPVNIRFHDGTHYVLICCCRGMKIFQKTLLAMLSVGKDGKVEIRGSDDGSSLGGSTGKTNSSSGELQCCGPACMQADHNRHHPNNAPAVAEPWSLQ